MAQTDLTRHIGDQLLGIVAFIAVIWGVFLLDLVLPIQEWVGLVPRDLQGLSGILTMTFLHIDATHLIANTVPLAVLLVLLAASRANTWITVVAIVLLGGSLLWLFGRNGEPGLVQVHIGASVLIFGLVTFLIARAIFERDLISIVIAVIVGVLYGSTTLTGIIPSNDGLSWDGHLAGAIAGIAIAFSQKNR